MLAPRSSVLRAKWCGLVYIVRTDSVLALNMQFDIIGPYLGLPTTPVSNGGRSTF